ncbi:MAG: Coenzyme hydrogenase/dehydrogenase, beta subunit terminus [Acidimicrobiaceae bacterium]|jgi:coenzyme F420 hydrogenase subunit beta|nr:Coenzyme hydrogenase/dehydrogenase, beta subunit terminus [Acidimicrobiaceae bacterium]
MTDLARRCDDPAVLPVNSGKPLPPFRLRASMNGITEAPGKVWFFELAAAVIDADRCVRCGVCVAACPTDSIGIGIDDLPMLVKMCTGCSLCWDFCPRGGLRYETTWLPEADEASDEESRRGPVRIRPAPAASSSPSAEDVASPGDDVAAETTAGGTGSWSIVGADPAPGLGAVVSRHAAKVRSGNPYRAPGAQDGGVVSTILLAALDAGEIDGALVARVDPKTPWRGVPYVATTRQEILKSAGSFYNQTMALAALDLERVGLGADARIAVVGTPCEIQGVRALQQRAWYRGSSRVDAIVLTIALLCTKSFDYRKLMLDALRDERGLDLAQVGKVDVIHGRMIVENLQHQTIVDEPVKAFHGAALKGCDECADFLGRSADLSVGSVGSAEGWSSILVRTNAGAAAFERAIPSLELAEIERPEALEKLDRLDKRVASESLRRPLDPDGPMFIDFAEHLASYEGSDRSPIWRGW